MQPSVKQRSGGAKDLVGRRSRRAQDVATSIGHIAPDLSRSVDVVAHRCARIQTARRRKAFD
jgi:hypothetical protein